MGQRDPVEARAERSHDLYDIATWEPRSRLDRLSERVYGGIVRIARYFVYLAALLITIGIVVQTVSAAVEFVSFPIIGVLTGLSAIPAFGLALYVYVADVTTSEPLSLLVATFVLSVLFAGFAAIINSVFGFIQTFGPIGYVAFFFVVVAPVEETVKLLSVRLYAFRDDRFDAVIDGAVYGAIAGLGFATIENAIYISRGVLDTTQTMGPGYLTQLAAAGGTTAVRALAGPGHVIYSAFAGYYLGLAKFNSDRAGPIVVKGLLIAAFIHALYNTLATIGIPVLMELFPDVPQLLVFLGFVVVFQGFFGLLLFRKLRRYTRTYKAVRSDAERSSGEIDVESTEFDG